MEAINIDDTAPCVVCGALPQITCDFGYDARPLATLCHRPLCWIHASIESTPGDTHGWDGVDIRCPTHATSSRQVTPAWSRERLTPPGGPSVCECAGCGIDFLDALGNPTDAPLCTTCAQVQPCGHLFADTMADAAGQPFCARCLWESREYADHH
jgi:hypothetical protein